VAEKTPATVISQTVMPDLSLQNLSGAVNIHALEPPPQIISFVNSWSPAAASQLAALSEIQQNNTISAQAVFLQETAAKAESFRQRGYYTVPVLADPLGELVEAFQVKQVPFTIFLDPGKHIKTSHQGILSADQMRDMLKETVYSEF
jgi:hypothetical protein